MSDQCGNCTLRGNLKECEEAPCWHHENWYAIEKQNKINNLERLLAKARCSIESNVGVQDIYVDYDGVEKLKEEIDALLTA